ncbi:calpain-8-like [Convolutriloba macropyga]|uniref:calpain-8-like n=1 Tax=Convolutriloba macropyga TaxID=536237 RepID=UPI003F523915
MLKQSTTHHYEDTEFLCKNILEREGQDVFWLRPTDVSQCPVFAHEGNLTYYSNESLSPDSYLFLCVAAALKKVNKLPIWPAYRASENGDYFNGRIDARFYRNGIEASFNIDDLLPYTSLQGSFAAICSYGLNSNEFWISYLEKAYIKFLGSHAPIFQKSIFELITEMTGCLVERRRIKFKSVDREWAKYNIKTLMKEYDCFGFARSEDHWIMFEKSPKFAEDVDLFPLRYGNLPEILDDVAMNGDTGDIKPTLLDCASLVKQVDDLLFCWFPTPKMYTKSIIGYWMCGKNAGGPQFESTYSTNPQIRLLVHEDFPEEDGDEIKNQILVQVELLRPRYGTITAKIYQAMNTRDQLVSKRLPPRFLKKQNVLLESEATEKSNRPWVTMRISYARDGDVFFIVPSLPEKEMCGGYRVKVMSSVVISDLEENNRPARPNEVFAKCRKKTCVHL